MKLTTLKKTFVIAEVSANHCHKFNYAVRLIREAKKCGADAVKFQAYTPETITINCANRYFRIKHPVWGGQTLYDLYKKAYTPWEWLRKLKRIADSEGIMFFATAFDATAVDFLESLNVAMHKIASFELIDLGLVGYAAKTKKPLMLSTGMASLSEIKDALATAKKNGARDIMLLKCVSSYPAKPEQMNLRTIPDLQQRFHVPVGISDHSLGTAVSLAAVTLGARVVEKHFKLEDGKASSVDSFFSITPKELAQLVADIRIAEKALGRSQYLLTKEEQKNKFFRRSLFITKDIQKGDALTAENLRSIRPAGGLAPKHLTKVLGKRVKKSLKRGTPLQWPHLEVAP